ncbi:hypothetical protein JVT61DRAFT_4750 [Boletus reticuloceps]|uniref:Uncharacterized protein n=1 Tax=Boletus reticuloceps TaxID=495285 RepID=A0A8I3A8R9_9AGAM|nr:hypothetical protein JVT61DRAFT_4750 [Boletus reticuloceps]
MLLVDASGKMMRFAKSIFEERDKPLKKPPNVHYYEDIMNVSETSEKVTEDVVDEETNNWPVEAKSKEALDEIKYTHCVLPLRVYKDEEYVKPRNVNAALRNSMVEVLFSVHHTYLGIQTPAHDTFRANIEQIKILKQDQAFDETSYSHANVRSGPIAAKTFSMKHHIEEDDESESRHQKICLVKGKEKESQTRPEDKKESGNEKRSTTLAEDTTI